MYIFTFSRHEELKRKIQRQTAWQVENKSNVDEFRFWLSNLKCTLDHGMWCEMLSKLLHRF